jgi:hypothetical protein
MSPNFKVPQFSSPPIFVTMSVGRRLSNATDMHVEIYSATVEADGTTVEATSATVLVAPYNVDDGSNSFCSAALLDSSEWTEVTRKTKTGRPRRPPSMQGSTE